MFWLLKPHYRHVFLISVLSITQEGLKPLLLGELVCQPLKVTVFTQVERESA